MLFKRLPPIPRAKVLAYIEHPTFERWREVRDIIVSPGVSLHDAVDTISHSYPIEGPDAILVARASAVAERHDQELAALEI